MIALFITLPGGLLPTELYLLLILQNIYLVNANMLPTLLATRLMRKSISLLEKSIIQYLENQKWLKIQYWFLLPTYLRCNEQRFY